MGVGNLEGGRAVDTDRRSEPFERKAWQDARWLAGADVRKRWLSFPVAALVATVIGLLAANLYNGIFLVEGAGADGEAFEARFNAAFSSFFMLATSPYLVVNMLFNPDLRPSFSRDDNFTRQLTFLRSLPIPMDAIVGSRMLTMLVTLSVAAPAFFAAFYLLASHDSRFAEGLGFVWFVFVWIGVALLHGGGLLYIWMARSKPAEIIMPFVVLVALLLIAVVSSFLFDHGLLVWTMEAAREHGPLVGMTGLLVGVAGFAFGGWRTSRRLRRRDLSA